MRARRWLIVVGLPLLSATGCEVMAGLEDRELAAEADAALVDASVADAPADARPDSLPAKPGFTLSVKQESVVLEPNGAPAQLEVTIARQNGFTDAVAVLLGNPPAGVTGSGVITANASTAIINVYAGPSAVTGKVTPVDVLAVATPSGVSVTKTINVRVGHLLLLADVSTTFVVPADVTVATILAWGGGGGGGATAAGGFLGGAGGAGGYGEGTFVLTPNQTLAIKVATGGGGGTQANANLGGGGAGGGYSVVSIGQAQAGDAGADASVDASVDAGVDAADASQPSDAGLDAGDGGSADPYLLVVGGGAGGSGGYYYPTLSYASQGRAGGNGSGGNGTDGVTNFSGKGGSGVAAGAGGTSCLIGANGVAGSSLLGASADSPVSLAGTPGGGRGGSTGGGGGGGGFFGGGGGARAAGFPFCSVAGGGGGGGGSGHLAAVATKVLTLAGSGVTPPNNVSKYFANGISAGGVGGGGTGGAGGPGRVVIYIP